MANKNFFKAPFLRAELRMPDSNLARAEYRVMVGDGDRGGGGGRRLYGNMIAR